MSNEHISFNAQLPKLLRDKLKMLAAKTGLSIKHHLSAALTEYLEKAEHLESSIEDKLHIKKD